MSTKQILRELESLGTAQNRKVYKRHGVGDKMFGLSFANLKAAAKKIKSDKNLLCELWQTGNHDVRILAAMIARPEDIDEKTLDTWVKDLDNYVISDAFSKMTSQTTFTRKKMEKWIRSKDEWIGTTGWNLLAYMAMKDGDLPDSYFSDFLDKIEADIHQAKNRTRHSMNNALIAIGIRNPALQKRATAAAKRIGKVEVDHGETGCKTPDAIAYIEKTVQRKKK